MGKGGAVSASSTTALTTGRFQGNACTAAGCQGGGLYVAGVLVVTGTEFLTNTSAGSGGGLYANGTAVPGYWDGARLTNVLLQDNSCLDPSCKGGGLYAADTLVLTGVDFVGNISWGGRGGGAFAFSTLTMTDTDFIANTSLTGAGGAEAAGEVTFITQGRFQENTCTGSVCSGGGLTVVSVVATVTGTEFISNTSQLSGGGVYSPGSVTVVNGVFQGNACNAASCMGGGLQVNNMLILTGTQFIANASIAGGGGVMVAGDGALTNAVFQGNTCTGVTCAGGGVLVSWSTTILRSSFDHNQAAGSGGAVAAISGANLTLANVTLATNNATLFGGAVYVTGTAQAQLLNVTLFLNYALSSGGGLYAAPSATMGVTNTLIQGNAFTSCAGQVDVGTHNLEYKGADCAAVGPTAGFTSAPSNQEALALNAPGTTWTSALLPGSAARDAGDAATCAGPEVNNLDQRGVTRPIDGDAVLGAVCDIGAYEAPACVPVVTSLLDPGDGSLRAAVACASTQAGSTVTFDSSLAGGTIYLNLGQISLTQPITIDGSGAPGVTVDAGGTNRVFDINAAGTVTLTSLVLQHGFMSEPGGAAIYAATPLVLSQVQLLTNTVTGDASHGGAVYAADALVISGTVLQGNTSVADGGAVYALGAVTLTNNWFQGNACTDVGCLGGAFWGAGASRVASSAFTDNQAGLGGAVGLTGTAALTLTNVTLSGNTATTGGGLYMGGEAGARLLNVSVVSNTAASGGGLFGAVAATLGVTNTLFSGNSGGSCAGQLDAGTHNLEWPGTTCATAGPAAGFTSADLLLGPLAFNGPGATPTHALLMDSPARDAGLAAVCGGLEVNNRDQRGAVRPFDGDRVAGAVCDIGAYEAQDAAPDLLVYLPLAVR